ncbi:MAG: hypothetical protein WBA17_12395 [Saprospiraceae bacterium]
MRYLLIFVLLLGLMSCKSDPADNWSELALLPHGISATVLAPDSSQVKTGELAGLMKDVTVRGPVGSNYSLQIFMTPAMTNDISRLISGQLQTVRENRYFQRVVEEETNGFIYEIKIDTIASYGFRRVVFKGDQEIVFQNGMGELFSEEAARNMYRATAQQ